MRRAAALVCRARAAAVRLRAAREPQRRDRAGQRRAARPGKAEDALAHYDKAVAKLPGEAGAHFDRGAALYALSRFDEAGQEFLRATQGQGPGAQGVGVPQPRERASQEGEVQGGGRGLQARAGAAPRRQGGEVEPGDRAPEAEGRGEEEAGREGQGQGQEQGRQEQERRQGQEGRQDKRTRTRTRRTRTRTRTRRTSRTSKNSKNKTGQAEAAAARESGAESARAHPGDAEEPRAKPKTWRRSGPACARCAAGRRRATGDGRRLREHCSVAALARWRRPAALLAAAARTPPADRSARSIDRAAVAPDQPFVYQRHADDLATASRKDSSRPTSMACACSAARSRRPVDAACRWAAAAPQVENNVTWSYQLARAAGDEGPVTIGAAHVRVGGQDLTPERGPGAHRRGRRRAAPAAAAQQRGPSLFPRGLFGDERARAAAARRVVRERRRSSAPSPTRQRAFVGEQVTVTWYLYLAEMQSNFQPITQPKPTASGSEEIPSTNPPGRLAFTDQVEGGQHYQVAVVLQRALFPLAPGKLTVTPMEAEVAQRRLLRAPVRRRAASSPSRSRSRRSRCRAKDSRPASLPATSGASRSTSPSIARAVAVGDAVTLTMTVRGDRERAQRAAAGAADACRAGRATSPRPTSRSEPGAVVQGTKTHRVADPPRAARARRRSRR